MLFKFFFTDNVDLKHKNAFTTLNRVEKDAFVLNEVAFLFVKDVLDLWYIGCCF